MTSKWKQQQDKAREKRLAQIRSLHAKDKTTTEIANFLGVSRQRAHQLLVAAGCKK